MSASALQHYCSMLSLEVVCDFAPDGETAVERLKATMREADNSRLDSLAHDGQRHRSYDLVVVDPDLPRMSGYALCSWYTAWCACSATLLPAPRSPFATRSMRIDGITPAL